MAKKFAELRASMPVESQQRAQKLAQTMMQELRQARGESQKVMHTMHPTTLAH